MLTKMSGKTLISKWMVAICFLILTVGYSSNVFAEGVPAKDVPEKSIVLIEESSKEDGGSIVVSNTGERYRVKSYFDDKGKQPQFVEGTRGTNDYDLMLHEKGDEFVKMLDNDTRSIIGEDDRWRITNTTNRHYRAVVSLRMQFPDTGNAWYGCTGWMVSQRVVMTAGHCIHSSTHGGWATTVQAWPGRNGNSKPYGVASSTDLYSVRAWTRYQNAKHDYGAIRLDVPLGFSTGTFGYGWINSTTYAGRTYNVTGYPGDKPSHTMWTDRGNITRVETERLFYTIDTFSGQSGSPVADMNVCASCPATVHAIHTTGSATENGSTRITPTKMNVIRWFQSR